VCGFTALCRRCPTCRTIAQISPDIARPTVKKWRCLTCGSEAARRRWSPAALADCVVNQPWVDLYRWLGLDFAEVESDPERRRLDGSVLGAEGISGLAMGGATIFFDRAVATLMIGDMRNARPIRYHDMTALRFAGRGRVFTTEGLTWEGFGFGYRGAIKGAFQAEVLNLLTRRTRTSVESIIDFSWRTGHVALLNNVYMPEQLTHFLAPTVARIEAEHARAAAAPPHSAPAAQAPPPGLAEQLRQLAALRDGGALSEDEFAAAKARLIRPSSE
jgi:hypothetical protein